MMIENTNTPPENIDKEIVAAETEQIDGTDQIEETSKPPTAKYFLLILGVLAGVLLILVFLMAVGIGYEDYALNEEGKLPPPPGEMINVDGHPTHLYCLGDGQPVVIMDTGLSMWSTHMRQVQQEISNFTRVCAYDRAGYGWSESALKPRTSRQIAEELHALLQKAGIEGPYILFGHMFGTINTRLYADLYPEDIQGLLLFEPAVEEDLQTISPFVGDTAKQRYYLHLYSYASRIGLVRIITPQNLFYFPSMLINDLPQKSHADAQSIASSAQFWRTTLAEQKAIQTSFDQLENTGSLEDMPLIIVASEDYLNNDDGTVDNIAPLSDRREIIEKLAELSSRGKYVIINDSSANILYKQTAKLADIIRQLIKAGAQQQDITAAPTTTVTPSSISKPTATPTTKPSKISATIPKTDAIPQLRDTPTPRPTRLIITSTAEPTKTITPTPSPSLTFTTTRTNTNTVAPTNSPTTTPTITASITQSPTSSPTVDVYLNQCRLVYVSEVNGNPDIYSSAFDGANVTRLTTNSQKDHEPSWSPDAKSITFASNRSGYMQIYSMAADGGRLLKLTNNKFIDGGPVWSPDGTNIAFYTNRDGNYEIYVMKANGTSQVNISNSKYDDMYPSWSPDGQHIVFQSNRDGNWEIYRVNENGADQTRLTVNPSDDLVPSWSPDGDQIAFWSLRRGEWNIYILELSHNRANQTTASQNPANLYSRPAWSPDGQTLYFSVFQYGSNNIFSFTVEYPAFQKQITDNSGLNYDPACPLAVVTQD